MERARHGSESDPGSIRYEFDGVGVGRLDSVVVIGFLVLVVLEIAVQIFVEIVVVVEVVVEVVVIVVETIFVVVIVVEVVVVVIVVEVVEVLLLLAEVVVAKEQRCSHLFKLVCAPKHISILQLVKHT